MHRVKLLGLALLALCAFGAFTAVGAYAEEKEEANKPQILVLEGKASQLEATLKATQTAELVNLTGTKPITATGAETTLKNCAALKENEKDTNLCENVVLDFTGVKQGESTACRSETINKEKDAIGTVLLLTDLHLSAELTAAKVLQPLLLVKVLGANATKEKEEELKLVCGLLKVKVTGVVACLLLPGLVNIPVTTEVEVTCKVNTTTHDRETGECNVLCTEYGGVLGLTAEYGTEKLDAWELVTLKGKANKDIYIDD
jgi:hypothetical protein